MALENRLFLYRLMWRIFAAPADAALLALLCDGESEEQVALLLGEDPERMAAWRELSLVAGRMQADALEREFTVLLVGPGALPSPPWESATLSPDGLLFTADTLAVRDAYAQAGYKAQGSPSEADDSLAAELDFMAKLTQEAIRALDEGRTEAVGNILKRQELFLSEHLNRWVGRFARRMAENLPASVGGFYPNAASVLSGVCAADARELPALRGLLG